MRWEISRIQRALASVDTPIIFLKGAAYLMSALANAKGRLSSDIDILVAKNMLPQVESALIEHGWEPIKLADYDQLYYRTWAHELPPLRHRDRNTVVDVHHTILPLTAGFILTRRNYSRRQSHSWTTNIGFSHPVICCFTARLICFKTAT
jgi:hypothetical protein